MIYSYYDNFNGVVYYRDGVSEGQFNEVLLNEMDAIRRVVFSSYILTLIWYGSLLCF